MALRGLSVVLGSLVFSLLTCGRAPAAPFDVYYRPSDKADWVLYGGRESRAGAEAAASDLAKSSGFETKVFALGEPVGRPPLGPRLTESIAVGGANYVRRPGFGYVPGWHRWGGGWGGGWGGWGAGWGSGWGGYGGSSSDHHHSSHHHSHEHHSSHHSAHHATAHPSHSAAHAGGRGAASAHHAASHHSHTHSHSHSHHSHSHGGHRK